ncbi:MAG: tRNA (adenosine(37)-N6)-threonylcarbamoyltransferase complex ATPase subunit type 1 TsaE [Chloroflexi bacterium]|nr:tRNA (adenosine(37)-N6)-threonylcarbamoyltransferase complex ATPase subunit type 1 TsaE [Chloroflexota bacterium]
MPILSANTLDFVSRSPEQTRRLGIRLGHLLRPGDVVALSGDLGSGKTTFTQGIAQGWGSIDGVSSPTFVLVNQYRRPDGDLLHHMDAYRIQSAIEAEDLDLEEMIAHGALIVEWAEKIMDALPREILRVNMNWVAEEQRSLLFQPTGKRNELIVAEFKRRAFGG